jgi:hypothetical protein
MRNLLKIVGVGAGLMASTAALAQDSGWRISEADGQVSVVRDETAIYGEEGLALQLDDVVRTSEAGRAVLVRGKEFYIVAPGAQVRIKRPEKAGMVAQVLDYLGDLLVSDPQPATRRAAQVGTVVKGYGNNGQTNDVLAAADAKMSLTGEE